jgi:hypothetical protein
VSLATTVYAAVTVLGTAAVLVAVQTADDGETAAAAELGPPRAVARTLLTTALPPLVVLAAIVAAGVFVGDLALATLGLGPRAFTPRAVVGTGFRSGDVPPLRRSGVAVAPAGCVGR